MITATTYGTWLRGDRRGWIDDGQLMPPDPDLEAADRERLKQPPFLLERGQLLDVGETIGRSVVTRLHAPILALHVGTWHFHLVAGIQPDKVGAVAKCAKDAVRFSCCRVAPSGRPSTTSVSASTAHRSSAVCATSSVIMKQWVGPRGPGTSSRRCPNISSKSTRKRHAPVSPRRHLGPRRPRTVE